MKKGLIILLSILIVIADVLLVIFTDVDTMFALNELIGLIVIVIILIKILRNKNGKKRK